MNFLCLSISLILSLVYINVATGSCPAGVNLCDYIQCVNGLCINDTTVADCYRCECPPGFKGQLCDVPIDTSNTCNPPCQNGGLCQMMINGSYGCTCPALFTGAQCETSIIATHPCVTMPTTVCKNGGTCTIDGTGYLCNCPLGWSGPNCNTQDLLTACTPNPCLHGTCLEATLPTNEKIAVCKCDADWSGQRCDMSLAGSCSNGYCQSGGTCVMNGTVPYCVCPSPYTGQQCETLLTTTLMTTATITFTTTSSGSTSGVCTATSCSNGGTCYNTGNNFVCVCPPPYTGPTCNDLTTATATMSTITTSTATFSTTTASGSNACSPNPCNNGGSCYKYNGGFVCVCSTAYTGPTCNDAKTTAAPTTPSASVTCANQPCQNGATCYNAGNSYFCYCGTNSRYTGKNCETVIAADPSCPLDCSPNGYCVRVGNGPNAYGCMCGDTLKPRSCST